MNGQLDICAIMRRLLHLKKPGRKYMKKLLSQNADGSATVFHSQDNKIYLETVQDVQPILERNKRLQREYAEKRQTGDYKHIACIPNTVLMEFKKKFNLDIWNKDDLPKIEKLLKSNEYKYLRTVDRI